LEEGPAERKAQSLKEDEGPFRGKKGRKRRADFSQLVIEGRVFGKRKKEKRRRRPVSAKKKKRREPARPTRLKKKGYTKGVEPYKSLHWPTDKKRDAIREKTERLNRTRTKRTKKENDKPAPSKEERAGRLQRRKRWARALGLISGQNSTGYRRGKKEINKRGGHSGDRRGNKKRKGLLSLHAQENRTTKLDLEKN